MRDHGWARWAAFGLMIAVLGLVSWAFFAPGRDDEGARAPRPDGRGGVPARVWFWLGFTTLEGAPDRAAWCFRRAIDGGVDDVPVRLNLGAALMAGGDLDGAIVAFADSLREEPEVKGRAYTGIARCLKKLGRYDEAIEFLERAISAPGDDVEALVVAGKTFREWALEDGGDDLLRNAVASLRKASEAAPESASIAYELALACEAFEDADGAIAAYENAVALAPGMDDAWANLGVVLERSGRAAAAIARLREGSRHCPKGLSVHYNLGCTLLRSGAFREAIGVFERVVRLDPGFPQGWMNYARALSRDARHRHALEVFRYGHALAGLTKDWPYPSEQWVADAEARVAALGPGEGEAPSPDWPLGTHRLVLDSPGGPLPFRVAVTQRDGAVSGRIINGRESIEVPVVELGAEGLLLEFPHYASRIRLEIDRERRRFTGTWTKVGRGGRSSAMRVRSAPLATRFPVDARDGDPAWALGRWRVGFSADADAAVGIFSRRDSEVGGCEGTFLTTLGDYRFLAGNVDGDVMKLSCFDGAHAFLFHARRRDGGGMIGDFWSSSSWHDTWTAERDATAALPDAWKLTRWKQGAVLSQARFRDLSGARRSLDDPEFRGKARIIEVFGSWCPNCHDHGAYMADLHRRYGARGLSIVGLAFEHTDDHARSVRQVEAFRSRHGATFPVLIAGLSDKGRATNALGLLDRVRSFPTTIFIDGEGRVRGIHQGFAGPATGLAHARLKARFEELIESMLSSR